MLRLSPSDRGRLQESARLDAHVAGAEANVATALASLGVETAWVSALPENPLGQRVARTLRAAGVDLGRVVWKADARLGLFFIEFGASPRPTTVWYDRAGSAFSAMTTCDPSALAGAGYAVTSGITLVARTRPASCVVLPRRGEGRRCGYLHRRELPRAALVGGGQELPRAGARPGGGRGLLRRDAARVFGIAADELARWRRPSATPSPPTRATW